MSWVKRVPPGDPDYFCDCPPCPFCFVWAAEGGQDRPGKKRRERLGTPRFVLPILAGIAFVLTVGITMRHEDLSTAAPEQVSASTSPPVPGNTPAPAQPNASDSAAAAPATEPPRAATVPAAATPLSDPSLPEVPVTIVIKRSSDGAMHRALLRNESAQPLLVTINVSNKSVPNKYMTQVSVAAADVTKLDGLPTAPGDRIILASAGYRDQVTYVP